MGHIWDPARYTLGAFGSAEQHPNHSINRPYACLVLNQPLENLGVAHSIYHSACYKVCADGGANFLMKEKWNLPDAICGDFDSILPDAVDYYSQRGVQLVKDIDQYSTDFMKCLKYIDIHVEPILGDRSKLTQATALDVVVLGGLGGRADQAFSQIHHLYLASEDISLDLGDIYLVTPKSIIFVLHKGLNSIRTPVSPGFLTENVGIIPTGRPSVISTRGLEWDVEDWSTEFGTQISTSNHVKANVVRVKTTERVLFTVELADLQEPETSERHVN